MSLALVALCAALGFLAAPQVYAGEGFNNHYIGGNEDFLAGALPPAGTSVFLNYLVDYNIGGLKDNAGRNANLTNPALVGNHSASVSANVQVLADALRFVQVTKVKILNGDLIWHVIIPFGYEHNGNEFIGNGGRSQYFPGAPSSVVGLADIEAGMGIAWHCPTFHQVAAIDIVAPTGTYDGISGTTNSARTFAVNPADLGRNYWSIDPLYAFTYLGDKSSPLPGLELSAKLMYWINTVNSATSYVSGQEFDADYLVGYHFNKNWSFGANGYILYQTTRDTQFHRTAIDPLTGLATGLMGREYSVGPALMYDFGRGCLTLKWQHDVYAENRPEGDKYWLKFIYPF
ncbi:MAG: transporter [Syntrophorhabdales bacterium]|jgi:hypothetical protein